MGRELEFLIPGDIRRATGGYVYDRRIIAELRARDWQVSVHALDASFPHPTAAALAHADEVLAGIPSQRLVLIDGLAFSAMPEVVRAHAARLALVPLIHMPLSADVQHAPQLAAPLAAQRAQQVRQAEIEALRSASHVFVTGRRTGDVLLGYGLQSGHISIVEPGTDEVPLARRQPDGMVNMLCVATVHPIKGHELLIDALAPLAALPWQLTCIGSVTQSPDTVARLRAQLQQHGISDRVALLGEVESPIPARYFLHADVFVLASRFESYCMAIAEALAYGLPVISTRTGAIPDLVGTEAGLLVEVDDLQGLRAALAAALGPQSMLARLAEGAALARQRLPRWREAGARFSQALEELVWRKRHASDHASV